MRCLRYRFDLSQTEIKLNLHLIRLGYANPPSPRGESFWGAFYLSLRLPVFFRGGAGCLFEGSYKVFAVFKAGLEADFFDGDVGQ